jgi:hypothetical protein
VKLSNMDVERIANILAIQAAAADDPVLYLRDLVMRAELRPQWRLQVIARLGGDLARACRDLVRWAESKGLNPDQPGCTTLGSLLLPVLDDVGPDVGAELVAAIVVHGLVTAEPMRSDLVNGYQAPIAGTEPNGFHPPRLELEPGELELQAFRSRRQLLLDVGFLADAIRRSASVCRVETVAGVAIGSGCLIGADLALTSRHVVVQASPDPLQVRLRCTSSARGTVVPLDANEPVPLDGGPAGLDFAVLRLARPVPLGQGAAPVEFGQAPAPVPGDGLSILQHPNGGPMQLATTVNAVIRTDGAAGIVRYHTQTAGGSSGAPCFDEQWRLVAIHRAERATAFGAVREGVLVRSLPRQVAELLGTRSAR